MSKTPRRRWCLIPLGCCFWFWALGSGIEARGRRNVNNRTGFGVLRALDGEDGSRRQLDRGVSRAKTLIVYRETRVNFSARHQIAESSYVKINYLFVPIYTGPSCNPLDLTPSGLVGPCRRDHRSPDRDNPSLT